MLSNNWKDSNAGNSDLSKRTATATKVYTAVIAGNTETTSGQYNGGFENIHRFLEDWSGITMTYKGSVAVLFNSQKATGAWVYGGSQYKAPTRSWSFDQDFTDPSYNIPGFPSVFNVSKSGWSID